MAYLTATRGFKSGGVYSGLAPDNTYQPEYLTSFDGGIRNRFLDNTLQVNLEGFYWKYRDYQFTFVNFATNGTQALVTTNAGKARLYGANTDIIFHADEGRYDQRHGRIPEHALHGFHLHDATCCRSAAELHVAGRRRLGETGEWHQRESFPVRLFRRAARASPEMGDTGRLVAQLLSVPGREDRCGRRCAVQLAVQARRDRGGLSDAEGVHDRQCRPGVSRWQRALDRRRRGSRTFRIARSTTMRVAMERPRTRGPTSVRRARTACG